MRSLCWVLGEDDHGLWIELPVGTPVYRGDELLFHGPGGGVIFVPPHDGWLAWTRTLRQHQPTSVGEIDRIASESTHRR
jgi:hypothetical protein